MQLFSGMADQFISKAINNEISITLEQNFRRYFGSRPSSSEVRSWTASLRDLAQSIINAGVQNTGVVVEYRLPMNNKRLDAMLIGVGEDDRERAVIVELKQWDKADACGIEDCVALGPKQVHLHPSRQAGQYAEYLREGHTAFYSDTGGAFIDLQACSYLHNANSRTCGVLLDPIYRETLDAYPLFTGDKRGELESYLSRSVGYGDGRAALQKVTESEYAPSKKLLDHVAQVIAGHESFVLLDEQLVAFNTVMAQIEKMETQSSKAAIIVRGGPGSGKSVIAVQLLGALAGKGRHVVHATGSKAFTTNLKARVGKKAALVFKSTHNMASEKPDAIDVLIADEAHRIREKTVIMYQKSTGKPQVDELLDAAKVCVFLLDEHQMVRPGEIGSPEHIRAAAEAKGADIYEFELEGQFRCAGSEDYIRWIDHAFGLSGDPDLSWRQDYALEICESPQEMEHKLQAHFDEGQSARMVAGFCWPWSDPNPDKSLEPDVVIGEWSHPWNRKVVGSPPDSKHPYTIWATQDEGFKEVGCIYSAQGFEFDYCGVIVGDDLAWDDEANQWVAHPQTSYDSVVKRSDDLVRNLANTYRVLLTRGMRGTYLYFVNPKTRARFEGLLASGGAEDGSVDAP